MLTWTQCPVDIGKGGQGAVDKTDTAQLQQRLRQGVYQMGKLYAGIVVTVAALSTADTNVFMALLYGLCESSNFPVSVALTCQLVSAAMRWLNAKSVFFWKPCVSSPVAID